MAFSCLLIIKGWNRTMKWVTFVVIDDESANVWCPTECYGRRKSLPINNADTRCVYVEAAVRIFGERSIISFILSWTGGRRKLIYVFTYGCLHCYFLGRDFNCRIRQVDQKMLNDLSCSDGPGPYTTVGYWRKYDFSRYADIMVFLFFSSWLTGGGFVPRKLGIYCGSKDAGFFLNFISVQKMGAGWHFVPRLRRNYLRSHDCFPDYIARRNNRNPIVEFFST